MRFIKPSLIFYCIYLLCFSSVAQDKIYFTSGAKDGKTESLSLTTVIYTPPGKKPSPVTTNTKKLILLFNKSGDFLAYEKLDFSNARTKDAISKFLNGSATREKDQIYTLTKGRIEDKIITEDKNFIYLQGTGDKMDKKTIAAIVYKDGHHVLLQPVDKAAVVLWDNRPDNTEAIASTKPAEKKDVSTNVPQPAPAQPVAEPKKDTPVAPVVQKTPAITSTTTTPANTAPHPLTFEEVAGNISKEEFEKKAVQKTSQLNIYLKIICDKAANYEEINKAIEQSVSLFVDENAMIETSSVTRNDVRRFTVRNYLSHIKVVNYDKIEIEWTNVQYVSDVKQGPDGNYYGVVSFEQVFRGYRDGKLVYQDVTRKNATVVLKTYEKNVDGNIKNVWDVLLSDIGVISTKPV